MKKIPRVTPPVPKAPILPRETLEIAERRELLIAGVLGIEDYHTEKVRIKTSLGIVEAFVYDDREYAIVTKASTIFD